MGASTLRQVLQDRRAERDRQPPVWRRRRRLCHGRRLRRRSCSSGWTMPSATATRSTRSFAASAARATGSGKGITAPNPVGQQFAIQRAWENAGLDPATATLVEAHGTSTQSRRCGRSREPERRFSAARRRAAQHRARLGQEQHRPPESRRGRGGLAEGDAGRLPQNSAADAQLRAPEPEYRLRAQPFLPESRSARMGEARRHAAPLRA